MQTDISLLQLRYGVTDPLGDGIRTCRRTFIYAENNCLLSVQFGITFVRIVLDRNIRHITEPDCADLIHVDEQCICDLITCLKFISDTKHPGVIICIIDIARRHREILCINHL